jgi:cytochrome P450
MPIEGSDRLRELSDTIVMSMEPVVDPDAVGRAMGAGNRDPEFWGPDADRVRLDRPNARDHPSFGGGVRHCLGANLARLEGRIYFEELGRRFTTLDLDGAPTRNGLINSAASPPSPPA